MYRPTGGSAGAESAAVSTLAALWTANGPAGGCAGGTRWAARGLTANPTTSAQQSVAPRAPVCADARPSVGEVMIPERAGCGKSARPVRRAATGNGVGINRIMPARHRASRRLQPKGRDDRAGFFSRGRARERKHSHALWWSEHVRVRGQKCPTGGAFGSARGPTPPCEGAASAVCTGHNFRKREVPE